MGPTIALVVVIVLMAAAAVVIVTRDTDPLPDSLLGAARMTGPEAQQLEAAIDDEVPSGVAAAGAMYGTGEVAEYILFVYEEPSEITFDEEWEIFSSGFASEAGEYQAGSTVDAQVNGDQARCAVTGAGTASVCVWGLDRHFNALVLVGESDGSVAMDSVRQLQPVMADVRI